MSKYVVDENDVVELSFYVDARRSKLKIYTEEEVGLLKSKEVDLKEVALSTVREGGDVDKIKALEDEIVKIKESEMPNYLTKETTWWGIPDGIADEYINDKGFKRIGNTPKTQYDSILYNKAFMAILLKKWTLENDDSHLKLIFEPMANFINRKIIEGSCLENICRMKSELYRFVTTQAYAKIYGSDEELKN